MGFRSGLYSYWGHQGLERRLLWLMDRTKDSVTASAPAAAWWTYGCGVCQVMCAGMNAYKPCHALHIWGRSSQGRSWDLHTKGAFSHSARTARAQRQLLR